jgi:hypothetical protein
MVDYNEKDGVWIEKLSTPESNVPQSKVVSSEEIQEMLLFTGEKDLPGSGGPEPVKEESSKKKTSSNTENGDKETSEFVAGDERVEGYKYREAESFVSKAGDLKR